MMGFSNGFFGIFIPKLGKDIFCSPILMNFACLFKKDSNYQGVSSVPRVQEICLCIRRLSFGIVLVILFEIRIRLPPRGKRPPNCEKIFEKIHAFYLDMSESMFLFFHQNNQQMCAKQKSCVQNCLFCIILVPPRKYGISLDIQIKNHIPLIYPPPRMLARHQPG